MSKKPERDVPGDSVASARAVTQYWYDIGSGLGGLDRYRANEGHDKPILYELKIKCDPSDEQGVLVMAKAYTEDGYVVGFHRGESVVEAVTGMARRIVNGTLKWREDQYAGHN